jgi:curli biogenesis system outer membrane secretion channel CsgG
MADTGCSSAVNRSDVVAQAGRTASTQVGKPNKISLNKSVPRIAVLVEPFDYAAAGTTSGNTAYRAPVQTSVVGEVVGQLETEIHHFPPVYGQEQIGRGIASQLRTVLSGSDRLSVLDSKFLAYAPEDIANLVLDKDEIGPIVIRGTITEFNEVSDMTETGSGFNLSVLGTIATVVGAALNKDALIYSGTGIATANPSYTSKEMLRKGSVSIDIEIIDATRGRLIDGCQVSGTFTSKNSAKGVSIFGISQGSSDFAASAIGQATRVAINDAVSKLGESLNRRYGRSQ